MSKIGFLVCLIIICIVALSAINFAKMLAKDIADYKAESACVANYIVLEYERRDIMTDNGTCWLKEKNQ